MQRFTTEKFQRRQLELRRFLSNEKLVKAHADLLFPEKEAEKKKNEFVHSVSLRSSEVIPVRRGQSHFATFLQINLDMLDCL